MFRRFFVFVIAGLLAVGLAACSSSPSKGYALDKEVSCLVVEDGARFRSAPHVPDRNSSDNLVLQIELQDHRLFVGAPTSFRVNTPDGAAVQSEFHNGSWYGVRRSDLAQALKGDLREKVETEDGDELVWVNKDRAQPCAQPK